MRGAIAILGIQTGYIRSRRDLGACGGSGAQVEVTIGRINKQRVIADERAVPDIVVLRNREAGIARHIRGHAQLPVRVPGEVADQLDARHDLLARPVDTKGCDPIDADVAIAAIPVHLMCRSRQQHLRAAGGSSQVRHHPPSQAGSVHS